MVLALAKAHFRFVGIRLSTSTDATLPFSFMAAHFFR
jgi:hypothetical protein